MLWGPCRKDRNESNKNIWKILNASRHQKNANYSIVISNNTHVTATICRQFVHLMGAWKRRTKRRNWDNLATCFIHQQVAHDEFQDRPTDLQLCQRRSPPWLQAALGLSASALLCREASSESWRGAQKEDNRLPLMEIHLSLLRFAGSEHNSKPKQGPHWWSINSKAELEIHLFPRHIVIQRGVFFGNVTKIKALGGNI